MMEIFQYILYIVQTLVALGVVIFVHELGHFLVAKKCGVRVEAILYISAMYGFSPGVSAPSSTSLAYILTTYASAPMNATTIPMLNIQ